MITDTIDSECENLAALATLFEQRGDKNQAARLFRLAGERAASHYANEAAVTFLSQALERTPDSHVSERFALLLARERVHALRGNQDAWRQDLTSLEFLANVLQSDDGRAEVAVRQAEHYLETGQYDTAVSLCQLAARLAQIAQSSRLEAAAYMTWGKALVRQGKYDWAQTQLAHALQLAQKTTIRQLEADSIRAIGILYLNQGDLPQARFCYLQAQDIYVEISDTRGQSYTLNNLGHIAFNRKRFTEAREHWEKALAVYQAIGDRLGQAMVYSNLGAMYMDVGDYAQAQTHGEKAVALSQQVHSPMGESMALINLSLANHYQGQQELALELSRQALALGQKTNNRRVQGYAFIPMGHALLDLDKPIEAQEAYWQSLAIWHELNQPNLIIEQKAGLARTRLAQGQDREALAQVEEILAHLKENWTLDGVESPFRVYLTCYQVLQKQQDGRAQAILQKAHSRLQEQAAEIVDEPLRYAFLHNVAAHRQIITEFTASYLN